ncbi:MAG: cell division protein FtsW [Cognaticolwellia sp.]
MGAFLRTLQGDKVIWMIVALLSVFSILAVYSATGTLAYKHDYATNYVMRHITLLMGGLILMYLAHYLHYLRYSQWAPIMIAIAVPLLLYTIIFGLEINDARRWIEIPVIKMTFQASDFAKLALIMYVARTISTKQDYIKDFQSAFLPIIIPIVLICGLIAPADLSSALLLFLTCVLLMFMGRVDIKYILLLLVAGIAMFGFLVVLSDSFPDYFRVDVWANRLDSFLTNKDGEFQVQQGKMAIADGGFLGVGPGNSFQRNYLPSAYADFIYAIIVEEYGLLGGFTILALYITLFVRCVRLVTISSKAFGAMLALGLSLLLVLQALVNMAVVVHLVPVTGLTLPMISMGGTSMMFTCISIGMILSVSRYVQKI